MYATPVPSSDSVAVVRWRGRVYVVAGGTRPGLSVSGANEFLPLLPHGG